MKDLTVWQSDVSLCSVPYLSQRVFLCAALFVSDQYSLYLFFNSFISLTCAKRCSDSAVSRQQQKNKTKSDGNLQQKQPHNLHY